MKEGEERLTKHSHGYSVSVDWSKVDEIREILERELSENNFTTIDCLTALCIMAIENAYNGRISKPNFLAKISQYWEEMDDQVNRGI